MRLPFWATILTLSSIGVLCILGTWQLHRLEWKTELLNTIEAEHAKDAQNIIVTPEALNTGLNMTRGSVNGHFQHDKEIAIAPRTYDGKPGYHILTPLKLEDNTFILVNRGWVPLDMRASKDRTETLKTSSTKITGLFRVPEKANIFVPENIPEKNQWYQINLKEIQNALKIKDLAPIILYAEKKGESFPLASATKPSPNNNHLQYAFFWFSLAGTLTIIYALRFLRK